MSKELNEELYLSPEAEATEHVETAVKDEKKKRKKHKRLGEVCELRGENKKVFRMDDGTEQAEFYPHAVHLLDEETGEYIEPDNTLVLEEDGRHYCNGKNRFAAKFSCEEDTNELFSMEKGIYKVTVSAKKSKKQICSGVSAKFRKDENAKDRIMFEGIDSVSDIEYSVIDNGVKENIIVKEKAPVYHYGFIIHCENVSAVFDDEAKRVSFVSHETGEEVFFIPAPFMKDANGEVSHDVSYEVKTVANGDVQLTVTAESEWINAEERALPVTIDPQIMVAESETPTIYTWCEGHLYPNSEHTVGIAKTASAIISPIRMYMSFAMPSLSRNPRIKKAEITFSQKRTYEQNSNYPMFGLYRVTENIAMGTVTPAYDSELIDYARFKYPSDEDEVVQYTFDVTSLMDKLNKEGASNANLVLKMIDETATSQQYIVLYGTSDSEYSPKLSITYESSYGVNSSYRTHTHELGRFGQGSIDLACGNLMFDLEDFAWAGTRMPVTIRHLYNSALSNIQYTNNTSAKLTTANFAAMKIGYGWKLNLMQSVVACSDGYIYIDENGDQTRFIESEKTATNSETSQCYHLFEDELSNGLIYDPVKKTIDLGGEIRHFDDSGRLVSIADEYNHIDITYTSNRISSVTDGAGREFKFTYNSNGQLTAIDAPDDTVISYAYAGNYLASITYPDGRKTVFSYSNSKPSSVTLKKNDTVSEQKINYTFNGDVVSSVAEYGVENSDFVLGTTTLYDHSVAANRTVVTITEAAEADETPNTFKKVYAFDDDGNIISEYMYSAETGNVEISSDATGMNPISDSGYTRGATNLLVDHNFGSLNSWSRIQCNDDTFAVEIVENSAESKFGKSFAKLSSSKDGSSDNGIAQSVWLTAGEYTFSAYIRVISAVDASLFGAAIWVVDGSNQRISASERITVANSEYIRLVAPFKITKAQNVKVQIRFQGKGIVYVDGAQVEEGLCANEYDLIENGSFEKCNYSWDFDCANVSSDVFFNRSKALVFTGDLEMAKKASQIIDIKESSSIRETFTLSAWAKANSLPMRERDNCEDALFRLCAEIKYKEDEITEEHTADFSPCTDEWQLVKLQFAKQKFKKVESVTVTCEYSYNSGTAYFDSVKLVRDSIETGLSASDFVTESESYDDEEVTTTVSEETAPVFEERKDFYGNTTTETTFTDGEFGTIYRSFQYIKDVDDLMGNNLVWESDARGNKTHYTVNEETSRNEEVIDRCGNKTAYEYDSMGRITKVTNSTPKLDENGNVITEVDACDKEFAEEFGSDYVETKIVYDELANVSYEYDAFDNMTEIVRGDGMKYALAYDAFHNLESIGIEGKTEPLVKYGYKKGSGRLKSVTYANGNVMYATYNSFGQMVGEEWKDTADGNTIAQYRYSYDGNGNIVRSLDILNKREYTYTYEDGRIVRAAEAYVILQDNGFATLKEVENTILYTYNSEGQLTKKTIVPVNGESTVVYIDNTDGNSIVKFRSGDYDITSHSKTDSFGRKVFDELQLSTGTVSRQFLYCEGATSADHDEYYKIKSTPTTQLVSQIILSGGRTISYEYDAEERITKVIDSVDGTTEYTYDALGQLLTETVNGEVVNSMEYDNYGNIVEKNGKSYTYGDVVWKDKLTAFDGQAITYDAQGNPLSYLGHALTWEKGRQLKSFDGNTYAYNANGIRTSKTVSGVKHDFTLDGTKILREVWGENTLVPMYDNEDSVCGIIYNNRPFYFQKNLQGDIIAIVDDCANLVARYTYDAWGVPTIVQDTTCEIYFNEHEHSFSVAHINPFRYRGYYYDEEIELYYLQSRYYNPIVGRFINADETTAISTDNTVLSCNIFTYCKNSSVIGSDDNGTWLIQLVCGVAGAALFGTVANVLCRLLGLNSTVRGWVTAGFAVLGGCLGAFFGPGIIAKIAPKAVTWVNNLEKTINKKLKLRPMICEGQTAIGFVWDDKFKIMLHFKHKKEPEKGMHICIQRKTRKNWNKVIPDIPLKQLGKVFINWVKKCLK